MLALAGEPAAKMFPDTTQGLVSLPSTPRFTDHWNKTQLGKLASDEILKDFWATQRAEIEKRISDAGWQLSLKVEDLQDVATGQTSVGWILRDGAKPYSIALVVDIAPDATQAKSILDKVSKNMEARHATKSEWEHDGAKVTKFLVPTATDEKKMVESHYVIAGGQLIAADDSDTIKEFLAAQSGTKQNALANSELYKKAQDKVHPGDKPEDAPEIEYFVRPIELAKLLRSVSTKPKKNNQQDVLVVLDTLGFGAIRCVAGNLQVSEEGFDLFHHGFAILEQPVSDAVKILDFPNTSSLIPPSWLNADSASVVGLSWNLKDAFPNFKHVVDAYAGEGIFENVIEGFRDDPQGPQVDVYKEVLPYLSSELFVVSEVVRLPGESDKSSSEITPNSKRSLVALKLNDPDNKLEAVVQRYGQNEPNGEQIDYQGYRIWSIKNDEAEDETLTIDLAPPPKSGAKTPSSNAASKQQEEEDEELDDKPILDQWAICVIDGYFVFGSDAELIKETIRRVKEAGENKLFQQSDVKRAKDIIESIAGDSMSVMQINRSDRSFEMQYELFREGKLNASRSVLALVLDRLLDPHHKNKDKEQKLKGDKLPEFEKIRHYFMPSGGVVRTEDDGWSVQSFVLGKE